MFEKIGEKTKMLIFLLDKDGRTLAENSTNNFLQELIKRENISKEVFSAMGQSVNDPKYLLNQIQAKESSAERWEAAYFYGDHYSYLLNSMEKGEFICLLKSAGPLQKSHEICGELLRRNGRLVLTKVC